MAQGLSTAESEKRPGAPPRRAKEQTAALVNPARRARNQQQHGADQHGELHRGGVPHERTAASLGSY